MGNTSFFGIPIPPCFFGPVYDGMISYVHSITHNLAWTADPVPDSASLPARTADPGPVPVPLHAEPGTRSPGPGPRDGIPPSQAPYPGPVALDTGGPTPDTGSTTRDAGRCSPDPRTSCPGRRTRCRPSAAGPGYPDTVPRTPDMGHPGPVQNTGSRAFAPGVLSRPHGLFALNPDPNTGARDAGTVSPGSVTRESDPAAGLLPRPRTPELGDRAAEVRPPSTDHVLRAPAPCPRVREPLREGPVGGQCMEVWIRDLCSGQLFRHPLHHAPVGCFGWNILAVAILRH